MTDGIKSVEGKIFVFKKLILNWKEGIKMESETRGVVYPVMVITQERLSDRGVKVS